MPARCQHSSRTIPGARKVPTRCPHGFSTACPHRAAPLARRPHTGHALTDCNQHVPARRKPRVLNLQTARMLPAHRSRACPPHATPAPTHSVEAGVLLPTRRNQGSRFVHPRIQGAGSVHPGAFSAPRRRGAEPGIHRRPSAEPRIPPMSKSRTQDLIGEHLASSRQAVGDPGSPTQPDSTPLSPSPVNVGPYQQLRKPSTVKTRPHQQPTAPTLLPPQSAAQHVPAAP